MSADLPINDDLVLPAAELTWTAVRSSGPGGQNVNKVATCVELRFDLAGDVVLPERVKARLRKLAGRRLDAEGRIVLVSQATRSQERNLADARQRLAELVERALVEPEVRRPTRPSKGAKERRLQAKSRAGEIKRGRQKPSGRDEP